MNTCSSTRLWSCVTLFYLFSLLLGQAVAKEECELDFADTSVTFTPENGAYECAKEYSPDSDCADNCIGCVWVCSGKRPQEDGIFSVASDGTFSCDCHKIETGDVSVLKNTGISLIAWHVMFD